MQNTTNNLGGSLRTTGAINSPQCVPVKNPGEIVDELNTFATIVEDLERLAIRLVEKLEPVSCHLPIPCEKSQEPLPNKTKCGQAIRELRVRTANVCAKLGEQINALEL